MKKEDKEVIAKPAGETQVDSFISQAIKNNLPVETMERLFSLREKVKAEQAREAFTEALANFQASCPIISKTKKVMNKDGRTVRYVYAPIDAIIEQIKKPLSNYGFSYTWTVENAEGKITAIAKITHKLGHSEVSTFTVPIDLEGYMSAPQKVASALTFAKRYALCNALGISTGDEDTDATDVGKEPEAKSDKSKILFLLRSLGEEAKTKEEVQVAVKKLTNIDITDKNHKDIIARLQFLTQDDNENK